MNVLIDTIRIAGFRGIKNLIMSLSRMTILIGTNNSGKTSLIKALHLALGDYSRYLSEEDFHIGADEKRVQEIVIDIRIVPLGENGKRKQSFDEDWLAEFSDSVKAEANGNQYVAIRSRSKPNLLKDGFDTARFTLEKWSDDSVWLTDKIKETRISSRILNISFIAIEAQRDIYQELKEKFSFIGKVLSSIEYSQAEVAELESMIKDLNEKAVYKSEELEILKKHLKCLGESFQGSGNAEITPFPKKIRDLSKQFSVHFGENTGGIFSMEYHGMGTRSWASMLTVKAFTDLMAGKHKKEAKPFFPVLAIEEPEAHLHPCAQKTLYSQISECRGQIIATTHSPYIVARADQIELRYIRKIGSLVKAQHLDPKLGHEERRRLQREVLHSRGEIIFSKVLILCEGDTEEQALPLLFQKYFGAEPFMLGVNFVGVGGSGKKYVPFLTLARDFSIPTFIFSDGEKKTVEELKKHYEAVYGVTDVMNCSNIVILDNTDFEGYLISTGFRHIIESAIKELDGDTAIEEWIRKKDNTSAGREKTNSPRCSSCKQPIYVDVMRNYNSLEGYNKALIDIMDNSKTRYAPIIAKKLCEVEQEKFPEKVIELFKKIKAMNLI